jgi:peptide/nickel transport system permease protein
MGMRRYVALKLLSLVPLLFGLSVLVFALMHALEGDAVLAFLGDDPSPERVAVYRERLGLDDPLPVQYLRYVAGALRGDLGASPISGVPVATEIRRRLPATLELLALALALGMAAGVPAGVLAATRRNSAVDLAASAGSLLGLAAPAFVVGVLLIWLFAVRLGWLPPSGYVPFSRSPPENLKGMVLPAVTLAAALMPVITRQTRSSMLEVLGQDYVRTARAKGLPALYVLRVHALRNGLIPIITVVGLMVSRLVGGAIVVETVFAIPGIGRLSVDAVLQRDLVTVQGVVLLMGVAVTLIGTLTDLAYGLADPRIRHG